MTIIIDDAGYGDLLFGVIVGAYRPEKCDFIYDVIDVKYFQKPLFSHKKYLFEAKRIAVKLIDRLKLDDMERVELCRGDILDQAASTLIEKLGDSRVKRVKVEGEAQRLTELAYLNEVRNLGYPPLNDRTKKWAKSFFHMMRWLKTHPEKMKWAKTGWPRLQRYRLFKDQKA